MQIRPRIPHGGRQVRRTAYGSVEPGVRTEVAAWCGLRRRGEPKPGRHNGARNARNDGFLHGIAPSVGLLCFNAPVA